MIVIGKLAIGQGAFDRRLTRHQPHLSLLWRLHQLRELAISRLQMRPTLNDRSNEAVGSPLCAWRGDLSLLKRVRRSVEVGLASRHSFKSDFPRK